jgi:hypothetical protein
MVPPPGPPASYVKKATRGETILATLAANYLSVLDGKWYYIGPFDNTDKKGFRAEYPPEKEIDLTKSYTGKKGQKVEWKEFQGFQVGRMQNLARFSDNNWACVYLYHEIDAKDAVKLPIALGSDDTYMVWCNGELVSALDDYRAAQPDQNFTTLQLNKGKNQLLVQVCNGDGPWEFYIMPLLPARIDQELQNPLDRDFPGKNSELPKQ